MVDAALGQKPHMPGVVRLEGAVDVLEAFPDIRVEERPLAVSAVEHSGELPKPGVCAHKAAASFRRHLVAFAIES